MTLDGRTLSNLWSIASLLDDDEYQARNRAFEMMKEELRSRILLQRKHLIQQYHHKLLMKSIGTNDIKNLATKITKSEDRTEEHRHEVRRMMKKRLTAINLQKIT